MAAKNDITGDSISTKNVTDAYRENFDNIFSKKEKNCGSCTWCTGDLGTCPFCGKSECDKAIDHNLKCNGN